MKTIAIVGATGAQGGGLARAILNDPSGPFTVRAITRDVSSEKARALARAGADVVAADLDDPGSLRDAFAGAHGAFCVTNFWEHFSPERELRQAKNLAAAAASARLAHVIWSTLENTRRHFDANDESLPWLSDKYRVPHFDAKGEADAFFLENGCPTTLLYTSFYWDNFIHFGMGPQRGADGVLTLALPMGDRKLPGIAAEDIGKCALGVFAGGAQFVGARVGIAGEHLTGDEMAAKMRVVCGEPVRYSAISPAVYRSLGFPGADDLGNMFQFKHTFNDTFRALRDTDVSRALNPALQSFDDWLLSHKDAFSCHA